MNNSFVAKNGVLFFFSHTDKIHFMNSNHISGGYIMNIYLNKPDDKLQLNLNKLELISQLKDNWNGYGAAPLPPKLIREAKNLIRKLYFQPQIFPTANGTIQIEFEKSNGDYLEFQFDGNGTCEVFRIVDNNEETFTSQDNSHSLNSIINDFYELSF